MSGHSMGAGMLSRVAATWPEHVRKLVMLDTAVPGDGSGTFSQHGRRWHHAFHRTADLPEALVSGREDIYLGWFYQNYGYQPGAISPADMEEYLRTYRQPGALRAGFSYYRALEQDVEHNEALLKQKGKLTMPVLALGVGKGFGRGIDTLESLQRVSTNVRGGVIDDCGHWMQEEKPAEVLKQVKAFLSAG